MHRCRPRSTRTQQRQYVYMVRDLGARRQPAMVLTIGGGAIFLALCYLLHRREKFLRAEPRHADDPGRPRCDAPKPQTEKESVSV